MAFLHFIYKGNAQDQALFSVLKVLLLIFSLSYFCAKVQDQDISLTFYLSTHCKQINI